MAEEQKYDWGGGGGGGWRERLQSSQLSARSVHMRRSKIGGAKAPLALPPGSAALDECYVAKWCEKSNSSMRSAVVVQERVSLSGSKDNLKLTCCNC